MTKSYFQPQTPPPYYPQPTYNPQAKHSAANLITIGLILTFASYPLITVFVGGIGTAFIVLALLVATPAYITGLILTIIGVRRLTQTIETLANTDNPHRP